jgi:hypothetical protein
MLYNTPEKWRQPRNWNLIGPLRLKSEADEAIVVELGGQNGVRDFLARQVELPPRTRVTVEDPFFSLSSLRSEKPLKARLGIHSPALKETLLVAPEEWGNIRVYGMEILLAGYMPRGEFGDKAAQVTPGTKVFQYNRTRAKNLAVPVKELKPIGELLEKVKRWEEERLERSNRSNKSDKSNTSDSSE